MSASLLRQRRASALLLAVAVGCGGKTGQGDFVASGGKTGTTEPQVTGSTSAAGRTSATSAPATSQGGGAGKSGGSPSTSMGGTLSLPTQPEPWKPFDKVDLLFTIDNSLGMADKQRILANGVPRMLRRLTNPDCVDPSGVRTPQAVADPHSPCPVGLVRQFAPVDDLHIGVISSSLGDFGGDICPEGAPGTVNEAHNDRAWLLGALERNSSVLGVDFLGWSAQDTTGSFATDLEIRGSEFSDFVRAAGELGCGFEMVLESWYRFLIDPEPPVDIYMANKQTNYRGSVDSKILELRKRFLRPDSLLVVFMLSDENDCSMKDQGGDVYSWVAMTSASGLRLWRGSKVCEQDPNDPCCFSCMLGTGDPTCQGKDPDCKLEGEDARLVLTQDPLNMRCRQNKRRFGFDFLFPPTRYVNALTRQTLCPQQTYGDLDCDCLEAQAKGVPCVPGPSTPNPLYTNLDPSYVATGPARSGPSSVLLAGVVGVPWQDLAKDLTADTVLEYQPASELEWNLFAPRPDQDYSTAELLDPFMIETTIPRSGTHPLTGQEVAQPEAIAHANDINGHEWYTSGQDVQHACTFSLELQLQANVDATRLCDRASACGEDDGSDAHAICSRRYDWCPCTLTDPNAGTKGPLDPTVSLSPLCQNSQGQYGSRQYSAGAYPGLRELQVLRGFHETTRTDNAIVGSICPKDLRYERRSEAGYGYNPALDAVVDRLGEKLAKVSP